MSVPDSNLTSIDAGLTFREEEIGAQRAAFVGRSYALIGVAVLVTIVSPWPAPLYIYGLLVLFFANGYFAFRMTDASWRRPWQEYALVFVDFALLAFTLIYPNPLAPLDLPPQTGLRFGNFVYFFILLAGLAYVYQPRLVIWGGISGAMCWFAGIAWLLSLPNSVWHNPDGNDVEAFLRNLGNPNFIDLGIRLQEAVVFVLTAGLLALCVRRMRTVALRQVEFAEQRTNLARYFPRQTANFLAQKSNPFSSPREQVAAVMFADIVDFTQWAEQRSPQETIAYLREAHRVLAEVIFCHDGTLDKFIGDGMMATFGTPTSTASDAINGLAAAIEMRDTFENWRMSLTPVEGRDLKLSIGLHYGQVVIGDIGSAERLEFATLGDVVNVASRLEAATRQQGCAVLISKAVTEKAMSEDAHKASVLLAKLRTLEPILLKGRKAREAVYCYQ